MRFILPLVFASASVADGLHAQAVPAAPVQPAAQPLFESHDLLDLRLEVPDLRRLIRDVGDDTEDHSALLSYAGDGAPVQIALEVETRGHFRRDRRNCNFPPLELEFPDSGTASTLFANQGDLKLVTHCQDGREDYEQYVLQEYLIYRSYNLLSDRSFRVRLARLTYVDGKAGREPLTKFAFIIEDHDLLAARNGCKVLEVQAHPLEFSPAETARMVLFQYMIGNTDWSISFLHNVRQLMCSNYEPVAVPYDFDWSGVISARYARPDPKLGIRSVRERLFRGFCRPDTAYLDAASEMLGRQEAIYGLWRAQQGLDPEVLERALEYFDEFFEILSEPGRFRREIIDQCRDS